MTAVLAGAVMMAWAKAPATAPRGKCPGKVFDCLPGAAQTALPFNWPGNASSLPRPSYLPNLFPQYPLRPHAMTEASMHRPPGDSGEGGEQRPDQGPDQGSEKRVPFAAPPAEAFGARTLDGWDADTELISIGGAMRVLYRGKWIILLSILFSLGVGAAIIRFAQPLYTAHMIVAPKVSESGGASGLISSALGSLGQLGLVDSVLRPDSTILEFTFFEELLTSSVVAGQLLERHRIWREVFVEQWDVANKRWVMPDTWAMRVRSWLYGMFDRPAWGPPTPRSLSEYLRDELSISETGDGLMRKIEYDHPDRDVAVRVLSLLFRETDDWLRRKASRRTEARIAYVRDKLKTVTLAEHRLALAEVLSELEKSHMLSLADAEFAVRVVEPPIASPFPTWPRIELGLALSVVLGFAVGAFVVLSMSRFRRPPAAR